MTDGDFRTGKRQQAAALQNASARFRGFTLIELLVVIAVIAIIASMIVALGPLATRNRVDKRAKAELEQIITAIESYKSKKGFYPPSNPNDVSKPGLYYELTGTRLIPNGTIVPGPAYQTLDRASEIAADPNFLRNTYGVEGFVNSTKEDTPNAVSDPDAAGAESFHKNIKPNQVQDQGNGAKYLGIQLRGPDGDFSRWRYDSDDVITNNHEGFDVWVEVNLGNDRRVYGNWKK